MTMTTSGKRIGRPFNTHTPLGKLMELNNLSVQDVVMATGINARVLSYYLAGHRMISQADLLKLVAFFELPHGNGLLDYEVNKPQHQRNAAALFFEQTTDEVDISGLLSDNFKKGTAV